MTHSRKIRYHSPARGTAVPIRKRTLFMHTRTLLSLSLVLALSACASTYTRDVISSPDAKLKRGKAVWIATPKNGFYGNTEYRSSGLHTATAIKAAFAPYSNDIVIASNCSDLACVMADVGAADGYCVVPEILHWEDRATEWSGIPDSIEIKVVVFDAKSRKELASTMISGKSKWATFGGDHPQDLLPEPLASYVQTLY